MKRILMAGAVVLLSLGTTRVALATTALELVTGTGAKTDIIYYNGTGPAVCSNNNGVSTVACSTFGTVLSPFSATSTSSPGDVSLLISAANFGGWAVTSDSGDSKSPVCDTNQICEDQNQLDVLNSKATGALNAYFASDGFTTAGPLYFGESSSTLDKTGTATALAYSYKPTAFAPPLGLAVTKALPALPGLFSTLSLTGVNIPNGGVKSTSSGPFSAPTAPYNLASQFTFSPTSTGAGYQVTETISTTSVPESSSVGVFLGMLLGIAFVVRGRISQGTA